MNIPFSTVRRLTNRTVADGNWYILFAIIFCLLLQLHLQFVQKINWDEFYFLSMVYEHQRGELTKPLQTLHVHLFGWLTAVGKDEIQKIEIARFCMWLFQIGSLILTYFISREFCSKRSSLIGVLCFLCSGYVLIHGVSFRVDPIAIFFVTVCVYLLLASKLSVYSVIVMAISMAAAILVTVKVVLFLPLLLWLALWQLPQFDRPVIPVVRLLIAAGLCFAIVLAFYKYQMARMPPAAATYGSSIVFSASSKVLFDTGFLPRLYFVKKAILVAAPQTAFFFFGVLLCVYSIRYKAPKRANALILIGFVSPILCLLFYRNAFPYFFSFIFLPATCVISYGASLIERRTWLVITVVLMLIGNFLYHYLVRVNENQEAQQDVVSVLHQTFPQGVNYFDRCSMLGSSKKFGFFMSSWGYTSYKKNGVPIFRNAAIHDVIPVVIANNSILESALKLGGTRSTGALLFADGEFLKNNYIHHWGAIWVAGVELDLYTSSTDFVNKIPGSYTVESKYPVVINGKKFLNNSVVVLDRGKVEVKTDFNQTITLRWGDRLFQPSKDATDRRLFSRF